MLTADQIREAATDRYGTEPGAAEDIVAGTPVLPIETIRGESGMGRGIIVLFGEAIRLDDGSHIRAVDPQQTTTAYPAGRRAEGVTAESLARRAVACLIPNPALPVDYAA